MTRKYLREMLLDAKKQHLKVWEDAARLQEARSKEQQIRGQQAMLDQKIKAEYDSVTKDVPSPIERRRRNKDKSGESGKSLEQRVNAKNSQGAGGSPYQVFRAPKPGNYVPAPKRTTEALTLKSFADFMVEGMTSKDFKDIYGGYVVTSIMSQSPELTGDETAQNILKHSANATNYAFGVNFPGSYINSIGDVNSPQSLSFADIQAHITTNHGVTPNEGEMTHPEEHVFTYQSEGNSIKWPTEYTFPDNFSDDLMYFDAQGNPQEWINYIWPVHGHPGNYTPLDPARDDTPFWVRSANATEWGHGDSNSRMRINRGRIDKRSITDTSFDVTYGAARSIDSSAFDLTGHMDENPFALGYETDYNVDANDTAALNALRLQWEKPTSETGHEDWQYIFTSTSTDHIDQLYGIDFPFAEYDYSPYEEDHDQFTGTDGWTRIHPNLNTDASFAKKIIKNVQVGDKISFSYKWYSDAWLYATENYADYNAEDYIIDGVRYGDHDWNPSYFRAVIGANNKVVSIKDQFQLIGADPSLTLTDGTYTIPPLPNPNNPQDNDLYNNHNITKKDNGFSFPYNGTYEYTVQEGDIDAAGLFQFTTILLSESTNLEYVQVTNFEHTIGDRTREKAGQTGKTTDAYDLGAPVAALDATKRGKKKKDEEEEEETNKSVTAKNSKEQEQKDTEDTFTSRGKTYDKGAYSVLGPYTPSVDKVELYPTYSDIKGQTEPPEPGTYHYLQYYRSYVPKEESNSEYQAWLSSIPKEQADKIRDAKQKADPAANKRYVNKFQMFGKPKLYGKYGDRSYYNPADTGQEVSNQVKITWNDLGEPTRQNRFGQILANPGEKQDSYGFPLGKDMEESDYTYWKGKRYLKGSYADTAEIDPETGRFRGNFSWFAEKDPASAKTGNSDTMSTTKNWKGPRAAWAHREFVGVGPNEEIEFSIQYRKHYDLMREKYGRLRDIPKQYHKNNSFLESLNRLVVATMPKGWARPFVPADDDMPVDNEPLDIEDFENKSDYDAYKAGGGDAARKNGMSVDDIIAQGRKNLESSDSDDPYHLNLGQIIKKFGNKIGNELAKVSQKLSTYRHAGEAFANFLLQQQGIRNYTKKNPYNVKLPRKDALALAKTFNRVLETQIPRERWNDLNQKDLDLLNDAANPESGPTPTNKYRKGTGPNRDEYHNIFNNLGERKGVKVKVINGKPYVTELNDNYVFTDPDDATVKGAPELIKFFTTAGGAQDRKDAAGGGEYTYQQFSGNINNLDLKMKNMPIRMKLPIPKTPMNEDYKNLPPKRTTTEGWSSKYKKSIDCDNPKGFSQRAHCQGRKKKRI